MFKTLVFENIECFEYWNIKRETIEQGRNNN